MKSLKHIKTIIFLALLTIVLAACGEKVEPTMDSEVGEFTAVNQDNEEVTNEDFSGEWWVADFVFTNCTTVCPPMTRNMSALQDTLDEKELNDKVQLVSFSVDPENDTPEALTEFSEEHNADLDNWTFLTGYDFEDIQKLSVDSFKSPVDPPLPDDDQVGHGTRFFLVDPDGNVHKNYMGTESEAMDELAEDLEKLVG